MDFIRRQDVPRPVSQTMGRYSLEGAEDRVYDNLLKKEVLFDDNNYCNLVILGRIHYHELWLLANKPLYMNDHDFLINWNLKNITCLRRDEFSVDKYSLYWKFKIECSFFPGFYYIPGYTRYVINEKGEVFSNLTNQFLTPYLNSSGYPSVRMKGDDGKDHHVLLHRILALTFKEWDFEKLFQNIDHLDGNPENYELENLEFVTSHENNKRSRDSNRYGRGSFGDNPNDRVYCEDMVTREVKLFNKIAYAASYIGSQISLVQYHLRRTVITGLINGRWLVLKIQVDQNEKPINLNIDYDEINYRVGSQVRPVLCKDISTGAVTRHESGISLVKESGLSRKQVYQTLKNSSQRVFANIIFKYEDDDTPWVI